MADAADCADNFIDIEVSRALGKIRKDLQFKVGPKDCQECGEDIPDARRQLGFKFCVECAEETERRKALFAR
jgi:RNA polymerase-binding transcription factor DksA